MTDVEYKFDLDQKVTTPFDDIGIITMLAYDEGGKCYYVKSSNSSNWFKEKELDSRD